ncbi:MAG: sigma 54-interacting transcriptional regulator [Ignavibacteria bacterium]|jgi:two-component system response regulator AtoC|nr:sigma 54-interacting transcriptional regulator [Ignavibacteria bacterium]MDH7528286.1 sigma 54-interacting transcriptional regulator [Ignavibacteria bacterium]
MGSLDKIKVVIINSKGTLENIDWLFKTIKDVNISQVEFSEASSEFIIKIQNALFVFNLNSLSSEILDFFKKIEGIINPNNVFISLSNGQAKELTLISRLGFTNIYYFPDDEFVLRNDVVERVDSLKTQLEIQINRKKVYQKFSFENLIGKSPKFLECVEIAKKVSYKSDATVLLLGETGTGKELFAKAIHYNSNRAESPFIELNTSAIAENLFESELFGYEKGAFTDAKTSKPGLMEIAENGTIFLDEIGDLNLSLQVKLLRAIENKTIKRVGGIKDIKIDCRIIAATNQNLDRLVEEKLFRADLYYRLKVISISLPPLRERKEDIVPLAEFFLDQFNKKYNENKEGFTQKAKQLLLQYSWPGNIRELSNVIERAILLSDTRIINEKYIHLGSSEILSTMKKNFIELKVEIDKARIENVTYDLAREVLKLVDGNKTQAAKILGISRPSLLKILNEKY